MQWSAYVSRQYCHVPYSRSRRWHGQNGGAKLLEQVGIDTKKEPNMKGTMKLVKARFMQPHDPLAFTPTVHELPARDVLLAPTNFIDFAASSRWRAGVGLGSSWPLPQVGVNWGRKRSRVPAG